MPATSTARSMRTASLLLLKGVWVSIGVSEE